MYLTFENTVTNTAPDGKKYFEFDIYIKCTNWTYFDAAVINIEYNELALGSNIVTNGRATAQRGEVIANLINYQNPYIQDYGSNFFRVVVTTPYPAFDRFKLGNIPKQVVHIKIEVLDCDKWPDVEFVNAPSGYSNIYFFAQNSSDQTLCQYNNPFFDFYSEKLCLGHIDDFNPKIIRAGMLDTLVIDGDNFGTQLGSVELKNAELGENFAPSEYLLDSMDIIS